MKIWFVNQYAIPPQQAGPMRHYSLAKELVTLGHEVTIVASSFDHVTQKETRLIAEKPFELEVIDGVRFLWLYTPPYKGNSLARVKNMLAFSWQVAFGRALGTLGKPDAVVGSSPHLFGAMAAWVRAKQLRVPFVLEIRDLWPQSLIDLGNYSERHPIVLALTVIERWLYRFSDHIVAVLPGIHEPVARKGGHPERITWIPNGVGDLPALTPSAKKDDGTFIIMYAGTHGLANGLDLVLDSAKQLATQPETRPVRFVFMGDGPERQRLMERARQEGIGNVVFEPPVPKSQVYGKLAQADAYLLVLQDSPVFQWGVSPNKLFDYMAMRKPTLFGINTPFNPVKQSGAGLTFSPGDPASLPQAVTELLRLPPDKHAEMGLAGRQYVNEKHHFTNLALKYQHVFFQVARR
ncbi:glycosyltransferase family 4 protein [Deinococcus antarcticus]|uniref:Glycosyltransferase family 4 protein n=1 Tax=Deinococcus antarcticus TaxID=1298767 RepID=A0ABV8A2W7_9DEIO